MGDAFAPLPGRSLFQMQALYKLAGLPLKRTVVLTSLDLSLTPFTVSERFLGHVRHMRDWSHTHVLLFPVRLTNSIYYGYDSRNGMFIIR